MDQLVSTICGMVSIPNKIDNRTHIPLSSPEPLYFVYDHCFSLAGKGCVMTGTIQSGRIAVNDEIEFPSLHIMRKVKSIQMFHKNIDCAYKGDRAGVCVQYGFLLDYSTDRSLSRRNEERRVPLALSRRCRPFSFDCVRFGSSRETSPADRHSTSASGIIRSLQRSHSLRTSRRKVRNRFCDNWKKSCLQSGSAGID